MSRLRGRFADNAVTGRMSRFRADGDRTSNNGNGGDDGRRSRTSYRRTLAYVSALARKETPDAAQHIIPHRPRQQYRKLHIRQHRQSSARTVTITARPNLSTRNTSLVNNVAITTDTTETNTANNSAQATITVARPR